MGCGLRVLLLHANRFAYRTVMEAVDNPPDPPSSGEFENCLVAFVTIEVGDGDDEVSRAVGDMVVQAGRLGVKCVLIYPYAHLSSDLAPPDIAYRVLVSLENALRSSWSGEVHRAPFGWYKAFDVSCPGHPLAELSRSFKGGFKVLYKGLPLEEAQAKGLLENWLTQRNPWSRETLELVERLGLDGVSGRTTLWELEKLVVEGLGITTKVVVDKPDHVYGLLGVSSLARLCSRSPRLNVLLTWGDIGESMVVAGRDIRDPVELLQRLGVRVSDTVNIALSDEELNIGVKGYSIVYRARKGGAVPLAYILEDRLCLGPLASIAYAMLDSGLKEADEGRTPVIHYKLAPIQVAIIPVGGGHLEYARVIASKLEELGARTTILREGGLGARIREAGRRWIPLVIVVGDREVETKTISLRRRWEPGRQEVLTLEELLEEVKRLNVSKPLP